MKNKWQRENHNYYFGEKFTAVEFDRCVANPRPISVKTTMSAKCGSHGGIGGKNGYKLY